MFTFQIGQGKIHNKKLKQSKKKMKERMVKKHSIAKRKTESTKQYGKNKSKSICTLALWWDRYFQFSQYKMLDSGENTLFNSLLAELYKENLQASIPYNHREENNELKQKQERIRKHEAKSKLERWGSP